VFKEEEELFSGYWVVVLEFVTWNLSLGIYPFDL